MPTKRKPKRSAKSRMPDTIRRELHKSIILKGLDPKPGRNPTKLIADLCAIIRDMDNQIDDLWMQMAEDAS